LTIRSVSREITIPVSYLGTVRDPWGAMRAAFETSITINRREFGLTWNPALETGLVLGELQGSQKKPATFLEFP
jgi:polyisoprenoid-binding protein YceI